MKKSAYSKFEDERSIAKSILPKVEGRLLVRRILMVGLYCAYIVLWIILAALFTTYVIYLMALSVVSLCILIYFTWRYVSIEYELTIQSGMLGFATIYGGLSRKELFSCKIHDLKVIAPYRDAGKEEADTYEAQKKLVMIAKADSDDNYYAIYEPENGEKTLLIFETEEKSRKLLKYYNNAAFRA